MSYHPGDRLSGRRLALRPARGHSSEPPNPLSVVAEDVVAVFAFGRRLLRRSLAAAFRWRRINRTIDELSGLDDHVLKDIGVSRAEIVSLAHELEERRRPLRPYWDR